MTDVFAEVNRSETSFLPPGTSASVFLNGVLTIIEKVHNFNILIFLTTEVFQGSGVFVEWNPSESTTRTSLSPSEDGNAAAADDSWVIEGSPPKPTAESNKFQSAANFSFSADLKDLRSYTYNEPKKGTTWIRFICKDGTASDTLHFRGGGYRAFVDCLQRWGFLTYSNVYKMLSDTLFYLDQPKNGI